jgi:hypothetical protein
MLYFVDKGLKLSCDRELRSIGLKDRILYF